MLTGRMLTVEDAGREPFLNAVRNGRDPSQLLSYSACRQNQPALAIFLWLFATVLASTSSQQAVQTQISSTDNHHAHASYSFSAFDMQALSDG